MSFLGYLNIFPYSTYFKQKYYSFNSTFEESLTIICLLNFSNYNFLLECMTGYVGLNCAIRCPYPSYGVNCQGRCACSRENCDVSTGCRTVTTDPCNCCNILHYFSLKYACWLIDWLCRVLRYIGNISAFNSGSIL